MRALGVKVGGLSLTSVTWMITVVLPMRAGEGFLPSLAVTLKL